MRRRARLPHWEQKGATYFVTFRLADALPAQTLLAFEAERAALLKQQESPHELSADEKKRLDELLSERIQGYLDTGAGACHLANPVIANIVANALRHFNGTRYQLFCWCIMPNHVHVIVRPLDSHTLVNILHSWKSFTALEANRLLGSKGDFWQREYYDHFIRDEQDFQRLVEYVVNNPIKARLENWQWVEVYDTYPGAGAESSATIGRLEAGATSQ
ncbi:MAG TPA: transposase, partial [Ktedonobacterales bacterium]